MSACAPELDELKDVRSERGTLGTEIYRALCRRVAGTEMPSDIDGAQSEALCLGDADEAARALDEQRDELPQRLVVLAERREDLVRALDDVFVDDVSDELDTLMQKLLPFYDPPEERIQNSTRALAEVMSFLAANSKALIGLEALGRSGMVPPEGSYGLMRAAFSYGELGKMFRETLPLLTKNAKVKPSLQAMLTGLAFELATSDLDNATDSDTRRLKDLLTRTHPDLASGKALHTAVRDEQGLPVPTHAGTDPVPFPFVDADEDGQADLDGARFATAPGFSGEIPAPFAVPNEGKVARDRLGRALAFDASGKPVAGRTLFQTTDADATVLAGALREAAKLFADDTRIAVKLAKVFPVLFGDDVATEKDYAGTKLSYEAPDTNASPVVDLAYGASSFVEQDVYDTSLELSLRLIEDEEPAWAEALEPLLALQRRTRRGNDAYPDAKLAKKSLLWDQLLHEVERLSRRRKTRDGETALEALVRATLGYGRNLAKTGAPIERLIDTKTLRHQGAVMATLMRYKDEWRSNPKGESKREPGEDAMRGAFKQVVDRSAIDNPVTCGKDGCGGLLKGSPFEDWLRRTDSQVCVLQNEGTAGKDCGQAANQSIYQRSLGLIWEMAGRSQCNKPITIRNLLEFATDACAQLDNPVSCTKDADCSGLVPANDYYCHPTFKTCAAKPSSNTCRALKENFYNGSVKTAEDAVTDDYTCPANVPTAVCNTDAALKPYPGAFISPMAGEPAAIQACHLINLPDVGRTFGLALTHEFEITVPNPWVHRYLEDVARASKESLPTCDPGDIEDPRLIPHRKSDGLECVPNAAKLSRNVYKDGLDDYKAKYGIEVSSLGELIEFLLDDRSLFASKDDTDDLRPEVGALSRVLFAPAGSTSFIMFDPLLIQAAPATCADPLPTGMKACKNAQGELDATGSCCIKDPTKPPLRYRLDTYYGATTFAWDYPIKFSDGTSLSFIESMKTISDAVNRTDYVEGVDDPDDFEGTDYAFSTIGKIVAEHYDSPNNPLVQSKDPKAPMYRRLTNLVSYESMIADVLDDGMIKDPNVNTKPFSTKEQHLGLMFHSLGLVEALDAMDFGGRDGIDVGADLAETLLSAHARCAGPTGDRRVIAGMGACDAAVAGVGSFVKPLHYRDGRTYICWNDGTCFNGKDEPFRYVSPMYLLIDPISAINDRIEGDPEVDAAFDDALGAVIDAYASVSNGKLTDRRARALLIVMTKYMRERWAKEKLDGKLASYQKDLTDDVVDLVKNPVFAGGLGVLEGMLTREAALDELSRFAFALLDDASGSHNQRALLATAADFIEALPGTQSANALVRALAEAIVPGSSKLASVKRDDVLEGLTWQNLALLRDTEELDVDDAVGRVLNNLVRDHAGDAKAPRPSALEVLVDVLMELNRAEPGAGGVMAADDWKAMLTRMADVMTDERRGFERLYTIVQCRNGGDGCE